MFYYYYYYFCRENRATLFATWTAALPGTVAVVYMECPEWGMWIASVSLREAGRCGLGAGAAGGMAERVWGPAEAQRQQVQCAGRGPAGGAT